MSKRRAIFLDRDGVINVNRPDYVKTWEEFVFLPNALIALHQAAAGGWTTVVTTNQAAIGRGLVDEATVREINARMQASVQRAGGRLDAIYFCPHIPEDKCRCRKPQPGMFLQAAGQLNLDLTRSYVIGDALADVGAAQAIGAQAILVRTGLGRKQLRLVQANHSGYVVAEDLLAAIEWIYQREKLSTGVVPLGAARGQAQSTS